MSKDLTGAIRMWLKQVEDGPDRFAKIPDHFPLDLVLQEIKRNNAKLQQSPIVSSVLERLPDSINHPPHYQSGGLESIDVIEAFDLNFRLGNTIKYILRSDRKGDRLENLRKAKWYLDREIEKSTLQENKGSLA